MIKKLMSYPEGMPLFYSYLKRQGYSAQLLYKYVKNGWLKKIGPGVYQRNSSTNPLMAVKAIQQQLSLPFHISAQSALYLQGLTHYIKFKDKYKVIIRGNLKLGQWISSFEGFEIIKKNLFKSDELTGTVVQDEITISGVEKALIEMCAIIPDHAAFDELIQLMDLAPSLRAPIVQKLLEDCRSIKAKRLFLYTAEKSNHKWFKLIDTRKIELGTGTRQIVKNGTYVKKYDICIPGEGNG
jgi:hypothetical protein